ncbi:hypothetical protein K431DRAFT_347816 [Polychaeton citri CBS 116435]|uniref:Uncharacterized protein n=1 Tax=Polychaeton citri CBS 116435 TaxID=1314669 RepID=A0A9P4Q2Y1_9PEZI|nr:hypothetical protein K431DRAFT_347816 [Polychaeton citri CBS 116435]
MSTSLPGSALRLPASRRISAPNASRLTAIVESPPPIPARNPTRVVSHSSWDPPPSYRERLPGRDQLAMLDLGDEGGQTPDESEKLAKLRQGNPHRARRLQRGGWSRFIILLVAALTIVAIALGVGLGTGLKQHRSQQDQGSTDPQQIPSEPPQQPFPIGQWRIVTNLRSLATNCTSNPATWRCYPYTVYDSSNPSSSGASQATFDWIITNTSEIFASDTTAQVPSDGSANLSISATDNPFSVSFTNQTLAYHADASNLSSARLTFSFEMSKMTIPQASASSTTQSLQQCST